MEGLSPHKAQKTETCISLLITKGSGLSSEHRNYYLIFLLIQYIEYSYCFFHKKPTQYSNSARLIYYHALHAKKIKNKKYINIYLLLQPWCHNIQKTFCINLVHLHKTKQNESCVAKKVILSFQPPIAPISFLHRFV